MFFNPRLTKELTSERFAITSATEVIIPECAAVNYIKSAVAKKLVTCGCGATACKKLTFAVGIPESVKAEIEKERAVSGDREEYVVIVGEETVVYAKEEQGLLYGLSTLIHLTEGGEMTGKLIYDYPVCGVRGYRVYMPGSENIGLFKDMIDLLAYYKFNAIILEIGGAMEYKKHPEINEHWVKFCDEAQKESGRYEKIKAKYNYFKNSVHIENGDGGYLTQEECRDIAAYCRERGLEVIPECPTLSHADYLLLPHPEFAEREGDEIPDTYCPNHPGIYDYVFEVLSEVIDVFKPTKLHIGHDEFYSMCICDRCKGKDPVDLYIADIQKLSDFLTAQGITPMMWGEKLLKAVSPSGKHYGGWYTERVYPDGTRFQVPDFWHCATKMPKEVTYLNWYWIFGEHLDKVYHDNGYNVVYGNFSAIQCPNFRERVKWGTNGGFVSNWGSNEDEYMQRNCQYFTLISTAYAFWCEDYDSDKAEWLSNYVMAENYRRHYQNKKNLIKVVHTTDHTENYHEFWCGIFIEDEKYVLGNYKLTYTDGEEVFFPVKYGTNITDWEVGGGSDADPADRCGSSAFHEVSGSTLPELVEGKYWYECGYENPHPEKSVKSFEYIPAAGKENINVFLRSVKF